MRKLKELEKRLVKVEDYIRELKYAKMVEDINNELKVLSKKYNLKLDIKITEDHIWALQYMYMGFIKCNDECIYVVENEDRGGSSTIFDDLNELYQSIDLFELNNAIKVYLYDKSNKKGKK